MIFFHAKGFHVYGFTEYPVNRYPQISFDRLVIHIPRPNLDFDLGKNSRTEVYSHLDSSKKKDSLKKTDL